TASLPQPQPQTKRHVWAGALLVLVTSLSIWLYLARRFSDTRLPPMKVLPFTSFPDGAGSPAFSPDGNQIGFICNGEKGDNIDIYTQLVDGGKPLRLTSDPATDVSPTWSGDGRRIAFVRITRSKAEIFTVSALGGEERKLITLDENPEWGYTTNLSWSPDGKFIAYSDHKSSEEPASIYLLSVESLEKQRLTYPSEQYWGDIYAEFSPDGKSLAINRFSNLVAEDLYIVPVAGGEARRLTFDNAGITGAAWTEEGREIIFASNRKGSIPSLWRISASGGSPKNLSITGENAAGVCISRQGHYMAYGQCYNPNSNIYRIDLKKPTDQNNSSTCLICSSRHDNNPHISPDGKRIAFESDRSGGHEVWVCNSD